MADTSIKDDANFIPVLTAILTGVFSNPGRSRPELSVHEAIEATGMVLKAIEDPAKAAPPSSSTEPKPAPVPAPPAGKL